MCSKPTRVGNFGENGAILNTALPVGKKHFNLMFQDEKPVTLENG